MPDNTTSILTTGNKLISSLIAIGIIVITLGVNVYQTRSNTDKINYLQLKVNEGELTRAVLRTELNYLKEYMSGEMDEIKMLFKEQRRNNK